MEGELSDASLALSLPAAAAGPTEGEPRVAPLRKKPEVQLDSSIGRLLRPRTNHAQTIHENDSLYNYRSSDQMSMKMGQIGHKGIQVRYENHLCWTVYDSMKYYHVRNMPLI